MKEEKEFKKKAHSYKNPHERCKFLVSEFISLSTVNPNKRREKTIKKLLVAIAGINCPEAYLYLGKLYYLPNSFNNKAYSAFKNAVKKGFPLAYYEFGYMIEKGLGCKKSKEKAVACYVRAATCGSIDAMYRLGVAYLYNELGLDNIPKGIKYLNKAAVLGHGEAAYMLSHIYETGIEGAVDINEENALQYLKESAELLYTPALDRLGWSYENGRLSNVKDKNKAYYYYLQAANNGYSQSMYSLAGIIMDNINLDDRLAFRWMLKATEAADPLNKSFYGMGVLYEYGIGTPRNLDAALSWYKKARDNNVPDAEAKIKDLEIKINSMGFNSNINNINMNNNINNMHLSTPPYITTNFNNENINYYQMDNTNNVGNNSEYYYSPIVMPSPAISVHSNPNDNDVIITKDQLKDMKLKINADGKIVSTDKNNGNPSAQNNQNVLDNSKRIPSLGVINENNNVSNNNNLNTSNSPYKKSPLSSYESISNNSDSSSTENKNNINNEESIETTKQSTPNTFNSKNSNNYLNVSPDNSAIPVPKRLSSYGYSISSFDEIVNSFSESNKENEDENDDNEDEKILSMEEDNNDVDVFEGLSYDPAQLNNNTTDIIEEKTSIKPSKSVKTYLPVIKSRKSNNNSTDSFDFNKPIPKPSKPMDNNQLIKRKESRRIFQKQIKLSDEERNVNNNQWIERHPTILSVNTDITEVKSINVLENDDLESKKSQHLNVPNPLVKKSTVPVQENNNSVTTKPLVKSNKNAVNGVPTERPIPPPRKKEYKF